MGAGNPVSNHGQSRPRRASGARGADRRNPRTAPRCVAVALAPATIAPARPQAQLVFAVARQDQLQFRSRFDLALHEEAIAEKWDPLTMEIL